MSKPKLLLPTLLTLLGIAVLCALGFWQLHRLEWKKGLIDNLDAQYTANASPSVLTIPDLETGFNFRRGFLRGEYDFGKQILVGPRVYKNLPGKHVFTPLRLEDGSYILVNRGWVPPEWKPQDETTLSRTAAQNSAADGIPGLLRGEWEINPFTPDNKPEKDQWYSPDIPAIAAARNIPRLRHALFFLEPGDTEGNYPIAMDARPELRNDHLQYAVFWFTMAGILAIIFVLRFLGKGAR